MAWGAGTNTFPVGVNPNYGQTIVPAGLSNSVAIAAGAEHNVALNADGTLVVWGANTNGQTNVPSGLSNVVAIATGGWHTLALKGGGTVVAWGAGSGSNVNVDYKQDQVPANLTNVVQIAAGQVNSLALVGDHQPVPQAELFQPNLGANGFSALLATFNGRVHQLEFKDSLSAEVWQSLPLSVGLGGMLQLTDAMVVQQRFYRAKQW